MKKAKIMMIDDETDILKINKVFLEGQGYETVGATTLNEARLLLEEHAPDLILLDVMMPDGLGWEFCAELRRKTSAPIIFLTSRDESESVIKGLMQGGDDYIAKPYDPNVLGARVMAQLRRSGVASAGKVELPPLYIDLLTRETILSGESILLTQKELQLLACFVIFAGRRLSCDDIYQRAWGEPPGSPHTISVHASNLRKKLKLDDGGYFELRNAGGGKFIFSKVRY